MLAAQHFGLEKIVRNSKPKNNSKSNLSKTKINVEHILPKKKEEKTCEMLSTLLFNLR